MINIKRILVPTDFSESAQHALTYGVSFAREYEGGAASWCTWSRT